MAAPRRTRSPLINMERSNPDPNYRYKFEQVCLKQVAKHKGTSVITNILQIADGIVGTQMGEDKKNRSDLIHKTAKHMTQFIRRKLGGQCQFKQGQVTISGRADPQEIQNIVFQYVETYAMCPECRYPELTSPVCDEVHCKSCGFHDVRNVRFSKKKPGTRKQKGKKSDQEGADRKESAVDGAYDEENEAVAALRAAEDKKEAAKEAARQKRMKKLACDPIFALQCFADENQEAATPVLMEKIKVLSMAHRLDRQKQIKMVVYALMEYVDNDHKALIASIKKYAAIFETFCLVKMDTMIFLSHLEEVIMHKCDDNMVRQCGPVLLCLYDKGVLDEDDIVRWYEGEEHQCMIVDKEELKCMRERCTELVQWLQNAESEDGDEDEEE